MEDHEKTKRTAEKISAVLITILLFLAIGTPAIMTFRSMRAEKDKLISHEISDSDLNAVMDDVMKADLVK